MIHSCMGLKGKREVCKHFIADPLKGSHQVGGLNQDGPSEGGIRRFIGSQIHLSVHDDLLSASNSRDLESIKVTNTQSLCSGSSVHAGTLVFMCVHLQGIGLIRT